MIPHDEINKLLLDFMGAFETGSSAIEGLTEMSRKKLIEMGMEEPSEIGLDMASKTYAMIQAAIALAREGARIEDYDCLDELKQILVGTECEHLSELLEFCRFRQVYDEDGDLMHSAVEVGGRTKGNGESLDLQPERLGLHVKRALEQGVKPRLSEEDWAMCLDLIERNLAGLPDEVDVQFGHSVGRVAERTEEEVSAWRAEIDDLFDTWEGGGT